MTRDPDGKIQQNIAEHHDWLDRLRQDIARRMNGFIEMKQRLLEDGGEDAETLQYVNGVLTRLTGWYIADLNQTGDASLHPEIARQNFCQEFIDECAQLEKTLEDGGKALNEPS